MKWWESWKKCGEFGELRWPVGPLRRSNASWNWSRKSSSRRSIVSSEISTVPPLHKPLIIYGLILVDIQQILSSSDPVEISDDTIDRRLDDFLLQFQEALDLLKAPTGQRSSPNSSHFFKDSHHFNIFGGNFIASTINPVVHDPVVREQYHKILQIIYIQCVVLFS